MGLLKDQNFTQEITPGKPIKASQVQGIVYSLSGDYPVDIKINGTLTAENINLSAGEGINALTLGKLKIDDHPDGFYLHNSSLGTQEIQFHTGPINGIKTIILNSNELKFNINNTNRITIGNSGTNIADDVYIQGSITIADDIYIQGFIEANNITVDQLLLAGIVKANDYKSSTDKPGISTSIIVSNPNGDEVTLEFENGLLVSASVK